MRRTLLLVPIYGYYQYARRTIESARTTGEGRIFILGMDDATPGIPFKVPHPLLDLTNDRDDFSIVHYEKNRGLTAIWNEGLRHARHVGIPYTVCANSDLIFAPGWETALVKACDQFDLAGPVTNAPGDQAEQHVRRFIHDYKPIDADSRIKRTANALRKYEPVRAKQINGFCMAAKTATWWTNPHDDQHVFDPKNRMVFQEFELQRRWHKEGRTVGIAPASFVFHYRSVTRGRQFAKGQAYRPARSL